MDWFVLYTRPRFEKKVVKELEEQGYEVFLPLKKELRQWSDRKKWIEEPLFRGYVFIKTDLKMLSMASQSDGVACPITFNGKPAQVGDDEIDAIGRILAGPEAYDVKEVSFTRGETVEITHGPLKGLRGKWTDYRGSKRVAIVIEQLQKHLAIEVPTAYVEKVNV
ncbi:MAG: UpxY family transcription antiterminator [Balneolales bacterium]